MGFFLLGRGREHGDLRLIADQLFDDRQEALDALSRLSAESDFPHRDADVFVADIDAAVPVLLVAPAAPAAPVADPVIPAAPVIEELPAVEPEVSAGVWEAPLVPDVEVNEPATELVPEPIAGAVIAEAADTAEAQPAPEAVDDLADALKRATGSLEAQGIEAPASIGPPPTPDEETVPAEAGWPWDPAPAIEEPESVDEDVPAEPIAAAEPVDEFVVPSFEEPSLDDAGLLSAASEEYLAPKPVIMGSYGDEAVQSAAPFAEEPAPVVSVAAEDQPAPEIPPAPAIEVPLVVEPASVTEPASVAGLVSEPLPDLPDEGESMLADLETIAEPPEPVKSEPAVIVPAEEPAEPALAGVEAEESDLDSLTCDDCVYVNTCPNKEELQPASCGTFQWKSV